MRSWAAFLLLAAASAYGISAEDIRTEFNRQGRQTPFIFSTSGYLSPYYATNLRERLKGQFPNIKINLLVFDRVSPQHRDHRGQPDAATLFTAFTELLRYDNYYSADAIYVLLAIEDRQFSVHIDSKYSSYLTRERLARELGATRPLLQQRRVEEAVTAFFASIEKELYGANKYFGGWSLRRLGFFESRYASYPTTRYGPAVTTRYSWPYSYYRHSRISSTWASLTGLGFVLMGLLILVCVAAGRSHGYYAPSAGINVIRTSPPFVSFGGPTMYPVPVQDELATAYPVSSPPIVEHNVYTFPTAGGGYDGGADTQGIQTGTSVFKTNNPARPEAAFDTVKGTW